MVVTEYIRPLKRMKRGISTELNDFLNFSVRDDDLAGESFRLRVASFLSRHARMTFHPELFSPIVAWQIFFRIGEHDSSAVPLALDIVEEDVTRSRSVYCNQCRVVGWSGHPVCRKRYHFIIRAQAANSSRAVGQRSCSRCGNTMHLTDSRCRWCNYGITSDDLENWLESQFEDNTHLLHGVIHSNGFGHLLTLNGRGGGSKILTGTNIMNFWDKLCHSLRVRKVSVMDVSTKYGMEYRLLHSITKGHSWYGNWGYELTAGSYAVTLEAYNRAISTLATLPLSALMFQRRKPRTKFQSLISFYQSVSETKLITLRDLFSFMLELVHGEGPCASKLLCAYTKEDLERVEELALKVLRAASGDGRWITRQTLKAAMFKSASPELLDYCLKNLGGKSIPVIGMVVQMRHTKTTGGVEFRLERQCNKPGKSDLNGHSKEQVVEDLKFLYDSLVHPETMLNYRPQATRDLIINNATKLLDCKQFTRDYMKDSNDSNPFGIRVWCHVDLSDHPKDEPVIPPELIVLPLNAKFSALADEVTKTFQEVYVMFTRFQVESLLEYGTIEKSISLKLLLGLSDSVQIRGRCPLKNGLKRFKIERGLATWIVDCVCGAKDDDGEKMLACDECGIWQHTRCVGIDSSGFVPLQFVCNKCEKITMQSDGMVPLPAASCKMEAMAAGSKNCGSNLTLRYGHRNQINVKLLSITGCHG